MKKRILVLTGATDSFRTEQSEGDSLFEDVLKMTIASKKRYAEKHGYDFKVLKEFGSDPLSVFEDNHIGPQRLLCVFDALTEYDVVMWLDGDALITNNQYSVEQMGLEENIVFCGSNVWNGMHVNNLPYFSTGNFMFHKTNGLTNVINAFYDIARGIGASRTEEQHILNLIHKFTILRDLFRIVPNCIFESVPDQTIYERYYTYSSPAVHVWNENNFLVHLTGPNNRDRIEIMEKYYHKYL